jgi:hypothetical protein
VRSGRHDRRAAWRQDLARGVQRRARSRLRGRSLSAGRPTGPALRPRGGLIIERQRSGVGGAPARIKLRTRMLLISRYKSSFTLVGSIVALWPETIEAAVPAGHRRAFRWLRGLATTLTCCSTRQGWSDENLRTGLKARFGSINSEAARQFLRQPRVPHRGPLYSPPATASAHHQKLPNNVCLGCQATSGIDPSAHEELTPGA